MRAPATLRTWWSAITKRRLVREHVEEELQFHIDAYTEDLIRRGIPEEKARRRARIEIGPPDTQGERYRNAIGLGLFDEIGGDLRYGFRALLRNPGVSCIAIR